MIDRSDIAIPVAHCRERPGAVIPAAFGARWSGEHAFSKDFSFLVERALDGLGVRTALRAFDAAYTEKADKIAWVRALRPKLAVEFHLNARPAGASPAFKPHWVVLYRRDDLPGLDAALALADGVRRTLPWPDFRAGVVGVPDRGKPSYRSAPIHLMEELASADAEKHVAVLVAEFAFADERAHVDWLDVPSYLETLASAAARGLANYLKGICQ